MPRKKADQPIWDVKTLLLFMGLPLLIGIILSAFIPQPVIGTITLKDPIDDVETPLILNQIRFAETHLEVRAVVLILDCPGGTINGTELIYLELLHLRQTKPVVTMVEGLSASGAYYLSVGTDYIIANPSALVGNVGVIGNIPSKPRVLEETYSTGPYKLWGFPQDAYIRQMDMMKNTFLQAILIGRGNRLQATAEKILRGEIYPGSEALRLGLVDEIGPQSSAIEKAADLAHISHYQVADLFNKQSNEAAKENSNSASFYGVDDNGKSTNRPRQSGFYYLYIPDGGSWQP
jgi:protease-4